MVAKIYKKVLITWFPGFKAIFRILIIEERGNYFVPLTPLDRRICLSHISWNSRRVAENRDLWIISDAKLRFNSHINQFSTNFYLSLWYIIRNCVYLSSYERLLKYNSILQIAPEKFDHFLAQCYKNWWGVSFAWSNKRSAERKWNKSISIQMHWIFLSKLQ